MTGPALVGVLAAMIASVTPLPAQVAESGTFLIRGGTVVVQPGQVIAGASVLIQDRRIAAVGRDLPQPADATVIEAQGRFVYPGMIDSSTPLGLYEIGSITATIDAREIGDINPQLRALTAVNPHSELIPVTR
ncbi:MAG TPA: hypothetical protein VGR27_02665, partial [Longimicrobiaceae bacterium]|nr:hypothetical protein [Longimicrobiaceae bacterium]